MKTRSSEYVLSPAFVAVARRVSKSPMPLLYGKRARTDGKTIIIPDGKPYDFTIGLISHEGAHKRFGSPGGKEFARIVRGWPHGQIVINILEDQRVDRLLGIVYPGFLACLEEGTLPILKGLMEKVLEEFSVVSLCRAPREFKKEIMLMAISLYSSDRSVANTPDFKAFMESKVMKKLWEVIASAVELVENSPTFTTVVRAARMITDALEEFYKGDEEDEEEDEEGGDSSDSGSDDSGESEGGESEGGESEGGESEGGESEGGESEGDGSEPNVGDRFSDLPSAPKTDGKWNDPASGYVKDSYAEDKYGDGASHGGEDKGKLEIVRKAARGEEITDAEIMEDEEATREIIDRMRLEKPVEALVDDSELRVFQSFHELSTLRSGEYEHYDNIENVALKRAPMIAEIRKTIDKIEQGAAMQRGHARGAVCARDLPRVVSSRGVFNRPFMASQRVKGADIMLLIDESGSMTHSRSLTYDEKEAGVEVPTRMEMARESAFILAEAFSGTNINFSIIGFGARNSFNIHIEKIYKGFTEKYDKKKVNLISTLRSYSENRDGSSIRDASRHFKANGNTPIMIVISDGFPYHGGTEFVNQIGVCHAAEAVKKARQKIKVFSFSIDPDGDSGYFKAIYGDQSCIVKDLEELPRKMMNLVRMIVSAMK